MSNKVLLGSDKSCDSKCGKSTPKKPCNKPTKIYIDQNQRPFENRKRASNIQRTVRQAKKDKKTSKKQLTTSWVEKTIRPTIKSWENKNIYLPII